MKRYRRGDPWIAVTIACSSLCLLLVACSATASAQDIEEAPDVAPAADPAAAAAPEVDDVAVSDDGAEAADSAEADSSGAAEPTIRLRLSVGAGRVEEAKAVDQSAYGGFMAGIDAFPTAGLMLSLEAGADYYDRRYLTNRAASAAGGLLPVPVREHRIRGNLRIGYDVLDAADISRLDGVLTPYLMGALDMYVNDPLPETLFSVGGGLEAMARIAEHLRLTADIHYAYAVTNNHTDVQDALLYGPVKGALGYGGGLWLVLPPHALIGLSYRGEWIANDTSRRFTNGAELTLGFEL